VRADPPTTHLLPSVPLFGDQERLARVRIGQLPSAARSEVPQALATLARRFPARMRMLVPQWGTWSVEHRVTTVRGDTHGTVIIS
jgi:hypothetical protein